MSKSNFKQTAEVHNSFAEILAHHEQLIGSSSENTMGTVCAARIALPFGDGFLVVLTDTNTEAFLPQKWSGNLQVGDMFQAIIVDLPECDGEIPITVSAVHVGAFSATVKKVVGKLDRVSGLILNACGLKLFCPFRQLSAMLDRQSLGDLIGTQIAVSIIPTHKKRRNSVPIASNRIAIAQDLKLGTVLQGKVKHFLRSDAGALVEFGERSGLLLRNEIVEGAGQKCSDFLTVGQEIAVRVKTIDSKRGSVILEYRSLHLEEFYSSLSLGQIVEGTVIDIAEFGAFVRLSPCTKALLHVSQYDRQGEKLETLVPGQRIRARVIFLNPDKFKISLSRRHLGRWGKAVA